jgi:hypothetical protein
VEADGTGVDTAVAGGHKAGVLVAVSFGTLVPAHVIDVRVGDVDLSGEDVSAGLDRPDALLEPLGGVGQGLAGHPVIDVQVVGVDVVGARTSTSGPPSQNCVGGGW